MFLKDFWKRSVIKLILIYLVLFLGTWLLGPHSPFLPAPMEVGLLLDSPAHGSGAYHDTYEYRPRI